MKEEEFLMTNDIRIVLRRLAQERLTLTNEKHRLEAKINDLTMQIKLVEFALERKKQIGLSQFIALTEPTEPTEGH